MRSCSTEREPADALHAQAAETLELAERLEHLTKGTRAYFTGTRPRARLQQAEDLWRVLEELAEDLTVVIEDDR